MVCTDIASGTRVSLTYVEEAICGVSPLGLDVFVDPVAMDKTGAAAGQTDITRTTGSFVTDQYLIDQYVTTLGFTTSANNDNWKVAAVTALTLSVFDPLSAAVDEISAGGQSVEITMAILRATGRELNLTKDILESEEVRPSRQFSDVRHGFNQVEGSPGYELSNISYSDFIRGVMSGEWEAITYTGGNLGITGATPGSGTAQLDRASGTWSADGFRPGDMITTTGFINAVNNALFRVVAVGTLTMDVDDPDDDVITEVAAAPPTVTYPGFRIDIGLNLRTFTMERRFEDIVQFQPFRGVTVNEMAISITPESIVGGTFGLLGMSAGDLTVLSLIDQDPVPAPTTAPFAAFDGRVYENAVNIAVLTSLEMSINNNRVLEGVVGSKFSPGVFEGRASVDGTAIFFLRGNTIYTKFFNETESSIWIRLADPNDATEFMNIVMPRVKYISGDMDPPQEGPVPLNMAFRSLEVSLPDNTGTLVPTSLTIQSNPIR